ncbi:MAG: ScaI family restriction endonuclease [Planctomycetaceae bacterium]|nr:ScaI family restriction endonuclease [Planctomycetaceae bacterium]
MTKTEELVQAYPLAKEQIVTPILEAWDSIFESKIGRHGIQIGKEIFPTPQIMASYLHELIPLEFAALYPGRWRGDQSVGEKDLVYILDQHFSAEIKTSSDPRKIYANRSYAQESSRSKKTKNGYYIAVNFEKFTLDRTVPQRPRIRRIRFGWLDHSDWKGQDKPSGQQASLRPDSERGKLIVLHEV